MFIVEPYDDELFSSWMMRLARKNHTTMSTLVCHLFRGDILSKNTTKLHIKDVDLYPLNNNQVDMLIQKTGVDPRRLQLFKYTGFLDEEVSRYQKKWLTEVYATKYNAKSFYATRFCPECFKEKVYIRENWRIMLFNICVKHKCYLLVFCPRCRAKFKFIDNEQKRELHRCHKCEMDLSKASVIFAKKKDLECQRKLGQVLEKGYYKIKDRVYYSIGLFILLKKLIHTVMRVHSVSQKYIEQLTPKEIARLISHTMFLLDHFPSRLNRFYKKNGLTDICDILAWGERNKQNTILPSWYMMGIEYVVRLRKNPPTRQGFTKYYN